VIAQPPIHFDRASGALEGANLWERTAALALVTDSRIRKYMTKLDVEGVEVDAIKGGTRLLPDRIKVSARVGFNVLGTASAFWQNRFDALNAEAARRVQ